MQRPDIQKMHDRLKAAFGNTGVFKLVHEDLIHTFSNLGLDAQHDGVIARIVTDIQESTDLEATERKILAELTRLKVGGKSIIAILAEKLSQRADIIYGQIFPYFCGQAGRIIDYGCGDGQVTDRLYRHLNVSTVGYDVRSYAVEGLKVPIEQFDGSNIPVSDGHFHAGLMTNVAHHEADNNKILRELARIIRPHGQLVVIETVPVKDEPEEFERTFVGDYVYNRLFHNADVPVPGTYETAENWVNRFGDVGFELKGQKVLGYDQPTIRDWHILYTFKRVW